MENNNALNKFFSDQMSTEELHIEDPKLSLVNAARNKIIARKKPVNEIEDFLSIVAAFLNLKVKLYHAAIATIIIGFIILYTTHDKQDKGSESYSGTYVSNIASVRSSTVLSSIYTFGLNKTQYDGTAN